MLNKRILIVEDEVITALDIKKSLISLGVESVSIVDRGKDAILKVNEFKPDLILMDIILKGKMDGIEAAGEIHQQSDVPIIYLTAYSSNKIFKRAMLTGPYGFIVKPIDFYELKCTLETAFYRYDLEKELREIKDNLELKVKERTNELVKLVEELKLKNFLLDAATDSIFLHDLEGNIIYANEAAYKSRGYTKDEILRMNIKDLNIQGLIIPSIGELSESGEFIFESADLCKDKSVMQVEIHSSIIKLYDKKFILSVVRDITKRKKIEKEKEILLEDLKRSNDELQQFAYVTSHDLQEPLRTIASFTQLLERRYKGELDSDADEFMDYIVNASIRMKQLIQDLLEYSRVSAKPAELKEVNCDDIIKGVISSLSITIEENEANINHDALPMVMADENLHRIFLNLILNAIKFKKPHESPLINISVDEDKKNHEFIFKVADNGIGMEKQYFNRIFIIFQRLHTMQEYDGTGIGLAIVKRIIDNYGGHIWVESEPGVGSTFYFTIPCRHE